MPKFIIYLYLLLSFGLTSSISPIHAEVRLIHNTLTVDSHNKTLKDVLDDLRQQGNFNIVAFEETIIGNVRISKQFWNLPLEKGLDRLLSGWNYGINRDGSTGKITVLYLVSQRKGPAPFSRVLSASIAQPSSYNAYEAQTWPTGLSETHNAQSTDSDDEEEDKEFTSELDSLSEHELKNLPPDLRKQAINLYRNDHS